VATAPVDAGELLTPGPWRHRYVAANGGRFHVALAEPESPAPLVLLLHGFPQCWQTWAPQLPALAAAGYRAAAMDLRGYGASDKPPRGYDTPTLAADVAAVVRSLGATRAVVVGSGWGAWIAWSMPALQPATTRAVAAVGMAHPLVSLRARQPPAAGALLAFLQVPVLPERRLRDGTLVERALRAGGPDGWVTPEVLERHHRVMRVPFTAHASLEYFRWVARSRLRRDGRAYRSAVDAEIAVPVLQLHGAHDALVPVATARRSAARAADRYRWATVAGAGHYLTEEQPEAVTGVLVDWLASLP